MNYALLTSLGSPLGSPARMDPAGTELAGSDPASSELAGSDHTRRDRSQPNFLRVGLVQMRWQDDESAHDTALREGVRLAAAQGAGVVCLPELTRSPYFASDENLVARADRYVEDIPDGPTTRLVAGLATELGIVVHGSCYERATDGGLGYNTAICVAPDGTLLARTRKMHIPAFPGYREDLCFRPGDSGFPVATVAGAQFGFPTCWDEWFPELARAYRLQGAEVLVHPTAIGSEPELPDFDTRPMWEHAISANGLANAMFMVVPNRVGVEGAISFYGSSFISDPYGRIVLRAPRDRPAVLVADLDLDQCRDWSGFGLVRTRRPEMYGSLTSDITPG